MQQIARRYRATVVLKGPGTLVVSPDGDRVYENSTGNPFMAFGGMGDLLSVVVAALSLNGFGCRVFSSRLSSKDSTRWQRKLREFLKGLPRPCALFAANDYTAAEVLTAAEFAGVKVQKHKSQEYITR